MIYIALPVHNCGFVDFGRLTIAYLALYVVYEIRNEINFLYLVRVFAFGIILSAVACIASIALAFISKQKKPFHGLAIAALIISFIYLAFLIFLPICNKSL